MGSAELLQSWVFDLDVLQDPDTGRRGRWKGRGEWGGRRGVRLDARIRGGPRDERQIHKPAKCNKHVHCIGMQQAIRCSVGVAQLGMH